jgi:hypothetical protein
MNTLHPLETTHQIHQTYLRYLKTIYPFQDHVLREAYWQALEEPDRLVKGPLLEVAPPFALGRSIAELAKAGVLSRRFQRLCTNVLPWDRALYLHQDQAITQVAHHQRNLIVATGTGSGKTEAFTIPILNHLLREEEAGTLQEPGVRALLLYPMNALANDQLKRLRRILAHYPAITYGRYTGETEENDTDARDRFYQQFPGDIYRPNELISRQQMRAAPPHILLTNYAMLEYLLLRPEDHAFFDGPGARHWRFLVLDEAHIYDGASGIEIAMLLRRLKDRIVGSEAGRLRCIATSATLGRGRDDFPTAAEFATQLFGETFAWEPHNVMQQDVIEATRIPTAALGPTWGMGPAQLYGALHAVLKPPQDRASDASALLNALTNAARPHVPSEVLAAAQEHARQQMTAPTVERADDETARAGVNAFVYAILRGDIRLHQLHDLLRQRPQLLDGVIAALFPEEDQGAEHLIKLVDLAVRARPDANSLALLPARYHVFARALEGAFACLNSAAHADHQPHILLARHETCPECAGVVVELATCVRCGITYIVGVEQEEGSSRILRQVSGDMDGLTGHRAYFLVGDQVSALDEDEEVVAGEEGGNPGSAGDSAVLCLRCGALFPDHMTCGCGALAVRQRLRRMALPGNAVPHRCISCGARSSGDIIYRFLTGQDAPVSVLATALYQRLPSSTDEEAALLPGEGRKLLIFSDSRQDAAFFAPYLERTYNQVLQRRLTLKTLLDDRDGRAGELRFDDVVSRLRKQAQQAGCFTHRQSNDERKRIVSTWLMQEFIALERRLSLEGLGLLSFRLVRPERWTPPPLLRTAPWRLSDEACWQLVAVLLDTLRQQGAMTFPENVDPKDETFAPRNKRITVREDRADSRASVLSWVPTQGSNRRLNLLERVLETQSPELSDTARRQHAMEALRGIWRHITDPRSPWRDYLPSLTIAGQGVVYQLSHELWEFVPSDTGAGYRCTRCRMITQVNVLDLCPANGCSGRLESLDSSEPGLTENHYRALYRGLLPIPLTAEEHTAQLTSDEAGKVQERFVRGEINVLSCSTTFELGVDVGELQAVLMRNVPPTTPNYVQRAGRAGRRTESAAFALTYAQRRSHDLTHYTHPERIVAGRIIPPRVSLANEKIGRRHIQAVLWAAFFRYARETHGRLFRTVGDLFQGTTPTGAQLLTAFAEERPGHVQEALNRCVPAILQAELGIADWSWLRRPEGDGMLDLLDLGVAEVEDDIQLYQALVTEAADKRQFRQAEFYERVTRTILGRPLLGFLASRNLLPKYGFPTDVVPLKTDHLHVPEAARIQLERDLRIAIAEYAPGADVVAAKRIWTSGGLYKQPHKDWPILHYAACPSCGRFHRSATEIGALCPSCGHALADRKRLRGRFIVPEFGFVASRDAARTPGESRPQRLYASRVFFAEYAPPSSVPEMEIRYDIIPALSSGSIRVAQYYSRFGKLALVNAGLFGRGFRVCQYCGYADMAPEARSSTGRGGRGGRSGHVNPRSGRECSGSMQLVHLGHEFLTDVLELRFSGTLAHSGEALWRSLVYALLEGAAETLGIRRDDLDGTLYRYSGDLPAIVLFDNVPGGAGHVRRIAEQIVDVFEAAYRRVGNACCGPETSCYECLRNYRNQPYHEQLQRGLVHAFLHEVLSHA